jgi:hypothetical protein
VVIRDQGVTWYAKLDQIKSNQIKSVYAQLFSKLVTKTPKEPTILGEEVKEGGRKERRKGRRKE